MNPEEARKELETRRQEQTALEAADIDDKIYNVG